jgi:predicted RNA-binding Zn-ribbon protein involved in translation (DUF1610 family)
MMEEKTIVTRTVYDDGTVVLKAPPQELSMEQLEAIGTLLYPDRDWSIRLYGRDEKMGTYEMEFLPEVEVTPIFDSIERHEIEWQSDEVRCPDCGSASVTNLTDITGRVDAGNLQERFACNECGYEGWYPEFAEARAGQTSCSHRRISDQA